MRILIVDDSKAMRNLVMRAVRQAGFANVEFREAPNGRDAFTSIMSDEPDLVLADWNMPEMTGIELLEKLRSDGCGVKLGFITSESDPALFDRAMRAGALFMLSKPFSADSVRTALAPVIS
jgi:two-component system chemotaxis response regulator CheY